jgi:hypothetical protein
MSGCRGGPPWLPQTKGNIDAGLSTFWGGHGGPPLHGNRRYELYRT